MGIVINGTNGPEELDATGGGDTLNGLGGNDMLFGWDGPDVINGGDGDDYINVRGRGSDTVDGGAGLDRVSYYNTAGPLSVNLETGTADDGNGSNAIDHLTSIERINGSNAFGDVIIGRADTNETLYGNGGNDTLDGGAGGSDTTSYYFAQGGVQVNLALGASSGADGADVLSNFENVEGSNSYNDTIIGDSGANILSGLDGDDMLTGAGGNDTIIGGAGNDRAFYSGNRGDYTLTTLANGDIQVQDNRGGSPDGTDTVRGVKFLQFADVTLTAAQQEQVVSSTKTGHQAFNYSIVLQGTGGAGANGYVTVFRAADANGEGIYMRLFSGDGEPRTTDLLVNTTTTGDQRAPTAVSLSDGGFVVMWDSTPEAGTYTNTGLVEIKMQRFDADGNKVGSEVQVNTTTDYQQRFPSVTATADGGLFAAWQSRQEGGGANNGIYGQKFDAAGAKAGAEIQINTTTAGNQMYPLVRQIATDNDHDGVVDGNMVVAWYGQLSDGSNGFAQQLLNPDGSKSGAEKIVYSLPPGAVSNFAHQTTVDGGYVLSWVVTMTDGRGAVMARTFNNDGTERGPAITAASGEYYLGVDVITNYAGNVMMVWDVRHPDGSSAIVGQNFNPATGLPVGPQYLVSNHSNGGAAMYPTLNGSGNGDVLVSWGTQGNPINGDSGGIYQQMINGNGETEFGVFNTGAAPAAPTLSVQTVAGGGMPQTNPNGSYVLSPALSSGDTVNLQHLALSGSAPFGTKVTIYSGDTPIAFATVDDQGLWTADLKKLNDGVYHLKAVVTDLFGNASAASSVFDLTVQSSAVINGTSGDDSQQYWYNNGANSSAQALNGGDGNDTIDGGGGLDTLSGGAGDDTYVVNGYNIINEAASSGTDTVVSTHGMMLPANVENLTVSSNFSQGLWGNGLDNVLKGGSGGDYLNGGAGNDVLDGGAGNDSFQLSAGQDTVLGGAGDEDTLSVEIAEATHGVNINLATQAILDNGLGETGVISGVEELEGSVYSDTFNGSEADETFISNGGSDSISGGDGFDVLIYGGKQNFTGSLATSTGSSADGAITFSGIEALGGGAGNDSLTGSSKADILGGFLGNDTLTGGAGDDTLFGLGGDDTAVFSGKQSDYNIRTTVEGTVTVQDKRTGSPDGSDTLQGVHKLQFSDGTVSLKAVDRVVSSNPGNYQIYQSTAANGHHGDGYVQVFRASDGSGDGLYARAFDSDGFATGPDVLINMSNTQGDQRAPVVASLNGGGFVVAYHSAPTVGAAYNDPGWDIKVQLLSGNGQPMGNPITVSTTPDAAQRVPAVTVLSSGNFVVTWQSAQAGVDHHLAVYARTFDSSGNPMGGEVLVGSASDAPQSGPAITSLGDGGYVIVWSSFTEDGHAVLMEQRFSAAGSKLGTELVVHESAASAGTLSVAHASGLAGGGHVLTWLADADGSGGGDNVVMVRAYDASGNPAGTAFVAGSAGYQNSCTVLGLSDGSYMVVWDVENIDGTSAIMGRRYGSDNAALSAEFKISNGNTAGIKLFPTLAEFDDGQIVVSWGTQGAAELTGSGGIYQQIIDYNGNPSFYAGDNSGAKPAAPTLTVQTVVGGASPVLDPAYPSAAYYLKDAPLSSGTAVSNSHLVISGTAAPGSSITVKDGTTTLGTAYVDDDGRWALDVKMLATGSHTLTATVTNLSGVTSNASAAFNLTINNVITGTAGADGGDYWALRGANDTAQQLTGLDGNDTMDGGGGADTLTGGAGDDTYIVKNTGVVIVEAAGGGTDTVKTAISLTLPANVENGMASTENAVALTGNALNNALGGNAGNDTLSGGAGADTLAGNGGDDTYVVDVAGDVILENDGAGIDAVQVAFTAAGTYALGANVENASVTGTAAINLSGNGQSNVLLGNGVANILTGNGGDDVLNGGAGNDTMIGGEGNDVYVVDAALDVVTEGVDAGIDTVQTALTSYTLAANVEHLKFNGTGTATFNAAGNAGANQIDGGANNDTLNGGAGNDTLKGSAGNDSLLGGDGDDVLMAGVGAADVADGGAGDDTLVVAGNYANFTRLRVTESDTRLTNLTTGETITIRNVEHVQFGDETHDLEDLIANSASPGPDLIEGTDNNDTLDGGAGADTLLGFNGDDTYILDNKDDSVTEALNGGIDTALVSYAAAGTYTLAPYLENASVTSAATVAVNLVGNTLDNKLIGNGAANNLAGNAGNDTLDGGAGVDTMVGGNGNDTYVVDVAGDVVTELANGGTDTVMTALSTYTMAANVEVLVYTGSNPLNATGNDVNNNIAGTTGNDTLAGGAGNDQLSGNAGNDGMQGGAGNDTLIGGEGNDSLDGGAGSDVLNGGAGSDTLDGGLITDKIGYSDANLANYDGATSGINVNLATGVAQDGYGGTDKLSNINFVRGSAKADVLTGSTALQLEQFEGGAGDDTIDGGVVTDTLNQENNNRVSYQNAASGVVVDLAAGEATGDATGHDTLANITQVRGSAHDDELIGSDSDLTEQFEGMAGSDTIDGKGGFDFARYDTSTAGVQVDLHAGTATLMDDSGDVDTLLNIEGVRGSAFHDELVGGNEENETEAFMGNGGDDYIDGGIGYDRVDYTSSTSAVVVDLAAGTAQDGLGGVDDLLNIEGVRGSAFNDTLLGSDAEFESFEGREGNDSIDGKDGTDRVDYEHAKAGVQVALGVGAAAGSAKDGYGGTDTLLNIEDVRGSTFNDTITGNAEANHLQGLSGNDSLQGGAGEDLLDAGSGVDVVDGGADADLLVLKGAYESYTITRPNATDVVLVNSETGENVTVRNVELFQFNGDTVLSYEEVIANQPSKFADVLVGTDDADTLNGLAGSDTMSGLDGDDTYVVDVAGDVIIDTAGHDTVEVAYTAAGAYAMGEDVEDAYVTSALAVNVVGNAADNQLVGNAAANALSGGAGDDTLDGGAGSDTMIGGDGDDTYYVDAAGDTVTEAGGGGTDLVKTTLATYTLAANVESLSFNGNSTAAFNATGNALDNDISGRAGNDTLNGGAGNDTLTGMAGDDSLLGGDGNDELDPGLGSNVVDGGAGQDTVILLRDFNAYTRTRISATETRLVNTELNETVIVRNVEKFLFNGVEKTLDEVNFNLPSVGNDVLEGTDANNTMDGGLGSDTMAGLAGDDTYVLDVATDVVNEAADAGLDTVQLAFKAAGTYTMTANVENAVVTGTVAINVVGNALDNVITGNALANSLTGGAGNDTLLGGAGSDIMIGGAGDDVYSVDVAGDVVTEGVEAGHDRVETTLTTYTLAANVEDLKYTGTGNFGATGNALDNEITGGVGKDTLNGGLGSDTLRGGAGDDSLLGGDGNDVLYAGTGNDVLDGGAGSFDTVRLMGKFADYVRTRVTATDTKLVNIDTGESVIIRNIENVEFSVGDSTIDEINYNLVSVGNDVLVGGAGNDTIDGNTGSDTMTGHEGSDTYVVDVATDVVVEAANEGTDTVEVAFKAAGTYVLPANVERAVATGTVAISLAGNELDNTLTGNALANKLSGGAGNDSLNGLAGADTMEGGLGNDSYTVDVAGDVVTEGVDAGFDYVYSKLGAYILGANLEYLAYSGVTGNFTGTGNALDNVINGGLGNDTLNGGAGNDSLDGSTGNDSLLGGDGDDALAPGGGADVVDGGAGSDTVYVAGDFDAYVRTRVTLTDTKLVNIATGDSVIIRNVETVHFADGNKSLEDVNANLASTGNDVISGGDNNDTLNGGAGSDSMSGGLGNDTYIVDAAGDVVTELEDQGTDTVNVAFTAAGSYTLGANVENGTVTGTVAISIAGNDLDNVLTGNAVANKLSGGAGNDTLIGGAGVDTLEGGVGNDVYVVDVATDVVNEGAGAGTDRVETALASYALGLNVENLQYTGTANFTGTGNTLGNEITGGIGKDTLNGGLGNDTLRGGAGDDSLAGGDGDDLLSAGIGAADIIDGGAGSDTVQVLGEFKDYIRSRVNGTDTRLVNLATGEALTIRNVETVHFTDGDKLLSEVQDNSASTGNDVLTGSDNNDTINGGAGSDTMSGYLGDDVYVVDVASDVVSELEDEGIDLVQVAYTAAGAYTLTANVENATVSSAAAVSLVGNALDNVLTGNAAANKLTGGAGNDTLNGGAGTDTMEGGAGNDVYVVDVGTDVVTEAGGAGTDRVETTLGTYTLAANVENLKYIGATAINATGNVLDNDITGGSGKDTLTGGLGSDTLRGGAGDDSLAGGDGDDLLLAGLGLADVVDGGAGSDKVQVLGDFKDYVRTRATLTDTKLVNTVTGETLTIRNVETVAFADGDKTLAEVNANVASPGNDSLTGLDGNDTLNGGAGIDTMAGGLGNDTYVIDVLTDVVSELADQGSDTVNVALAAAGSYTLPANVENGTVTGTAAISIVGNDLDNILTGNGVGNTLTGGIGNDTLVGGAGTDTLIGGVGNDVYVIDVSTDVVTEAVGAGTDRVETALANYTLAANVENLVYTGSLAFTATGNALANDIKGGIGADKLTGGTGNDTLSGGAGSDTLAGGLDADTFVLNSATGIDTISDLLTGTDKLAISQAAFAIGNGDAVIDGAELRTSAGGFSSSAELVVFTPNVSGTVSAATAAAVIGSAASGFTLNQQALFVVDNGANSYVYLFKSSGTDAAVSVGELTQIAVLTGNAATALADYQFVA
ncbi:hypothetical protein GTP45_14905 [Pseudoduganella sp. FT55W]|uniref:Uncharacterized protein n=1 Tax=Duganella rivi TaxID=2666083 RepID=A0A7X4GR27_9BURK|nr:Ig-like domain-containing protein [Duganella rivi]MYM68112.1 hypothetical protein [Duganella rivi]